MKRIFTLLSAGLLTSSALLANTPTIDGVFDGESVWNAPIGTGDGVQGWSGANARRLYVTWDANFVYLGAACRAESWQQFIFVVNTKEGGGSSDPWGRTITYNHTNRPDFLFRGDIAGSNYAEYHVWNGTEWTGLGTNINTAGTEVKGTFDGASLEGFIEIRVPRATLGDASAMDVQFVITGNNGGAATGHGCFDAIPNETNGTSWDAPGNATTISNYASNVVLPARLGVFAGELRGSTVQLQWNTLTELNLSGFGIERSADASNWQNIGFVTAQNSQTGAAYRFTHPKAGTSVSFYRLKVTDKDGSFAYSPTVILRNENANRIEIIGNPVRNSLNVSINQPAAETIHAELININGSRISNTEHNHPGGTSILQINTSATPAGVYLLKVSGKEINGVLRVVKQ